MWVTKLSSVGSSFITRLAQVKHLLLHTLSHRLKGLNSPLTWGYLLFPQVNPLVTTTTYNYIKTPVRFPFVDFQTFQLLKTKNLQTLTTAGRLTK